jgi:hypothetical protein
MKCYIFSNLSQKKNSGSATDDKRARGSLIPQVRSFPVISKCTRNNKRYLPHTRKIFCYWNAKCIYNSCMKRHFGRGPFPQHPHFQILDPIWSQSFVTRLYLIVPLNSSFVPQLYLSYPCFYLGGYK